MTVAATIRKSANHPFEMEKNILIFWSLRAASMSDFSI